MEPTMSEYKARIQMKNETLHAFPDKLSSISIVLNPQVVECLQWD